MTIEKQNPLAMLLDPIASTRARTCCTSSLSKYRSMIHRSRERSTAGSLRPISRFISRHALSVSIRVHVAVVDPCTYTRSGVCTSDEQEIDPPLFFCHRRNRCYIQGCLPSQLRYIDTGIRIVEGRPNQSYIAPLLKLVTNFGSMGNFIILWIILESKSQLLHCLRLKHRKANINILD